MRKRVVLVKGQAGISDKITLAEFERINIDHIAIIVALKKPQLLPDGFPVDLSLITANTYKLTEYWFEQNLGYIMIAEYASALIERGSEDVRVVEGHCLGVTHLYESIKAFHKQFKQLIIECQVVSQNKIRMNDVEYDIEEIIERFKPHDALG